MKKLKTSRNNRLRSEDIFINEELFEKYKNGELADSFADKDLSECDDIVKVIRSKSFLFEKSKSQEVFKQIDNSLKKHRRRKLLYSVASSAAIIFIATFTFLITNNNINSEITKFAQTTVDVPETGNTRLILKNKEEVQLFKSESQIEYTENGTKINIESREIDQTIESDRQIFNTVIVPYGKRTRLTLSDQSIVYLNSGSKLVYPAKFENSKREVFLEGEAIFEVSHNPEHPFFVKTSNLEIKVLGTVFSFSTYPEDEVQTTILESGSIELKYKSNSLLQYSKIKLEPGTKVDYDNISKEIIQEKIDTKYFFSWKEGIIYLNKAPLASIVKKLSRYYNVKINIESESLKEETFSGCLDLKDSPEKVLSTISSTCQFKFNKDENEIIIN